MYKGIQSLLILSLLSILLVQPVTAAAAKTVKIKVTLVSIELVENNHVGNEWYTAAYEHALWHVRLTARSNPTSP